MGRHKHTDMVTLTARVPRGHDGFWSIIRDLDKKGEWSVGDVFGSTNIHHRQTVQDYVHRLLRGGFAAVSTEQTNKFKTVEKFYRLIRKPADAPRLRRDGTLLPMPAQQRMWNAIRSLKQFDLKSLAYASSDEHLDVPQKTVQRYVLHLVNAGYVIKLAKSEYRLKRSMDTGPKAPLVLQFNVVFDANRNEAITDQVVDAEAVQ